MRKLGSDFRAAVLAGKVMSIPTDVVGAVVAGFAWMCGAENKSEMDNNSYFEMTGVPFLPEGNGLTLGHSIFYSDENPSDHIQSHERQHTFQAETLGPFYLPAHVAAQGVSLALTGEYSEMNPLEWGPYPASRGGSPGVSPWWW
jgi:hypothetical protein